MKTLKKYRKSLLILIMLFVVVFVTSCTPIDDNNKTQIVSPSKEFTVSEYIQNDMILQKSTNNFFSGTAEPNVKIIIEIINNKDKIVASESAITDKNGNWQMYIKAPENTKINYKIKIYDSFKKYNKIYNDIYFGNVFVIFGENMFFNKSFDAFNPNEYNNLRIYGNDGKWYQSDSENYSTKLTSFIMNLYNKLDSSIVGIIDLSFESASIGSFLNNKILEDNSDLKTYNNSVYELLVDDDNRKYTYKNSEIYEKYLNKFSKVSCNAIISYFGMTDYSSGIDFEINSNFFAKSFSLLIKNLKNNFQWNKMAIIETPSITNNDLNTKVDNIALLRNAQSTAAYYNNSMIIPTYELGNNYHNDEELLSFDKNLINLIYKKVILNYETPSYANLIIRKDELIIEFSNCVQLEEIDEINNFRICDKSGNEVTNLYEYYVVDNQIIINAIDENIKFVDITILYNFKADISSGNLRNEDSQVINPFIIIIEGEK